MEDLFSVHELELDAVRPRPGRRIDERAGFARVPLMGGSELCDDKARVSRADIPACNADHLY
jgi:hypothetical protein